MTETLFVHADTIAAHPGPADTTFPAADAQHYGVKIASFGEDDSATYIIALTHDVRRAIAAANRWWREKNDSEGAREITIERAGWWKITTHCDACVTGVEHRCCWWAHPNDYREQHTWRYEPTSPDVAGAWPMLELAVL